MMVRWEPCDIRCGRRAVKFQQAQQIPPAEEFMIGYSAGSIDKNRLTLISMRDGMMTELMTLDGIVARLNAWELVPVEIAYAQAHRR